MGDIVLGTYTDASVPGIQIICDDPGLQMHTKRGYFRRFLADAAGISVDAFSDTPLSQVAGVDIRTFGRHCMIAGKTGSGKTRSGRVVLGAHTVQGASMVRLEIKYEEIMADVAVAQQAGLHHDQVIIASPRVTSIPGWNPFLCGLPLAQTAHDIADVFIGTTYPRMINICNHLLILIGAFPQTASFVEAIKALQDIEVLALLVARPVPESLTFADRLAYQEAVTFFTDHFINGKWSAKEQATATAPILTRLAEILRSEFLLGLLCAEKNTIDLASLWHSQTLVFFHLDTSVLGMTGARILAGLVASMLFRVTMRSQPNVVVLFVVDEAMSAEAFLGSILVQMFAIARSQGLRVLISFQFLKQLSTLLLAAALSQSAVRIFFALDHDDSRLIASSIAGSTHDFITSITVTAPAKSGKQQPVACLYHSITDPSGTPLKLTRSAWKQLQIDQVFSGNCLDALYAVAHRHGIARLYVTDPETGRAVEVRRYARGLVEPGIALMGPAPLQLVIRFPKPHISVQTATEADRTRRWMRILMTLPMQHAVVCVGGEEPRIVRFNDVPDTPDTPQFHAYVAAVDRATGSPPDYVAQMYRRRCQRLRACKPQPQKREDTFHDSLF